MKKIWIVVSIVLAVLLGCGAGFLVWQHRDSAESPLEKTVAALFPELVPLVSMKDAGEVELAVSLDSDVDEALEAPLELSVKLGYTADAARLDAELGSGEEMLDASLLMDRDGLSLSSTLFPDGAGYGIRFEKLKEFSPESGNAYALSQELYELLSELAEMRAKSVGDDGYFVQKLQSILSSVEEKTEIKKEKREIVLLDTTVKGSVTEIGFENSFFTALSEKILEECREDTAFCRMIAAILTLDPELTAEEALETVEDLIGEALGEDESFEGSVTFGVYDGYLVYAALMLTENDAGSAEPIAFTLTWSTTSSPAEDARFAVDLCSREEDGYVYSFTVDFEREVKREDVIYSVTTLSTSQQDFTWAERTDRKLELCADGKIEYNSTASYAYDYETLDKADFEKSVEWEWSGDWTRTENSLSVTVRKATVNSLEMGELKIRKSTLTLTLSTEVPVLSKTLGATDLCAMSGEHFEEVRADLQEKLLTRTEKINSKLGVTLLQYSYKAQELGTVYATSYDEYAYDTLTQRLFVTNRIWEDDSPIGSEILVYDVGTMELVTVIPMGEYNQLMLAADNGKLVVGNYETLVLYDAESLTRIKELKRQNLTVDCESILLDGNKLILVSDDGFEIFDIENGSFQGFWGGNIEKIFSASLDRTSHTLCLTGEKWYNKAADNVHLYNTQTGEQIFYRSENRTGSSAATHFNGKAFYAYDYYRLPDGSIVMATSMVPKRYNPGFYLQQILYSGESCYITLESAQDGSYTDLFIYPITGEEGRYTPVEDLLFFDVHAVIPLSENEFLICDQYRTQAIFVKLRVGPMWTVGY